MTKRTLPAHPKDLPFVKWVSPSRPPADPNSWDGLCREMRTSIHRTGRWEGPLQRVLDATLRGGLSGHARALARSRRLELDTPMSFLRWWLPRSRMAWRIEEEVGLLLLLKVAKLKRPAGSKRPTVTLAEQPGLYDSEIS